MKFFGKSKTNSSAKSVSKNSHKTFLGARQQVEKRPEPIKRQGTASRAIEGMSPLVTFKELGLGLILGQMHPERLSFLTSFEFIVDGHASGVRL